MLTQNEFYSPYFRTSGWLMISGKRNVDDFKIALSKLFLSTGFSRRVNKPTTRQSSHANYFVNAKSHAKEKPQGSWM